MQITSERGVLISLNAPLAARTWLRFGAEDPALKAEKARLKTRLFDWMQAEGDALAFGGYHLPVGSYIDGRPAQEQHDHQQHLNPALRQ